ncbi:hypothetical protein [Streptomyces niveiscabiei]|uniref:RacP protein n=1 Tax=Streptomyces niveiscabiei TaxID=164115 RepID=A0ABW9HL73_9ACTN
MGRAGLPARVHGQAVRKALLEARPRGLTLAQLCGATKRTPSQVWAGLRFLRKVAVKEGLPPVTYSRREGFEMSEESEVGIAYERAIFQGELHRVADFITGIVAPHARKAPDDEWIRLVLDQFSGVKATLEVLTRMER